MNSILSIISTLCLIPNGSDYFDYVKKAQLECQQKYIKCVKDKSKQSSQHAELLADCVLENKND